MKLKEFFKPTWTKVITTIIIFLIIPVNMWNGVLPEICLPEDVNCTPMKVWFWKPLILQSENIQYNLNLNIILYMFIQLIISYFLSCLIIFTYKKIKSKSPKK